jgi:hypothetical protein
MCNAEVRVVRGSYRSLSMHSCNDLGLNQHRVFPDTLHRAILSKYRTYLAFPLGKTSQRMGRGEELSETPFWLIRLNWALAALGFVQMDS